MSGLPRAAIIRTALLALGIPQLLIGGWALFAPSGWHETFPGGGREWHPLYGPFNEHLVTDVGSLFVALGLLLVLAGIWLDRRLVQAAAIAYLAFEIPHLVFHLGADDVLPTADRIVSTTVLVLTVVVALSVLALTRSRAAT
jgi:hypothetical protein